VRAIFAPVEITARGRHCQAEQYPESQPAETRGMVASTGEIAEQGDRAGNHGCIVVDNRLRMQARFNRMCCNFENSDGGRR
jgi:hypothetical protein